MKFLGEWMLGLGVMVEVVGEVGMDVDVEAGLARGIGEEVEVGCNEEVVGCEGKGVVVMLRAEAVADDWAVKEANAVGVEVEEGVEAGLA